MKIQEMIEAVGTKDLQEIGKIWNFFDCNVSFPDLIHPYKELGVLVCRGRIIKKAHNCIIHQSVLGRGDYDYSFNYQNICFSVYYRNFELFSMMYCAYNNDKKPVEYLYIFYDNGELRITAS